MRTFTKSLATISLSCRGDGFDDEAEDVGYIAENQDNPLRSMMIVVQVVPTTCTLHAIRNARYSTSLTQDVDTRHKGSNGFNLSANNGRS